ncbi:MAG: response regulator [Suipraeoptans sp.]
MYKILIVDDEISARQFIRQIVEKKCPEYQVIDTAENGAEALEKIESNKPDIVISDIRMPVMDGVKLVEELSIRYPDIILVLVTGYQEFDYAKRAIKAGVSEYLLKPVKPGELQRLLQTLEVRLDEKYHKQRIRVFNEIIKNSRDLKQQEIDDAFESGRYFAVLMRKNGLPKRFSAQSGVPVYSLPNEKFFIYGRDEMEALYLINVKYMLGESPNKMIEGLIRHFSEEGTYITCIKYLNMFNMSEFYSVANLLYKCLNRDIVIGKNQIITAYDMEKNQAPTKQIEDMLFERAEYVIKYKETGKLKEVISALCKQWEKEEKTQGFVEKQLVHLFYLISNTYEMEEQYNEIINSLDEALSYISGMDELAEAVWDIMSRYIPGMLITGGAPEKEGVFNEIKEFLIKHMHEEIVLSQVCKDFGISQPTLSRMFRKQEDCSFSNYLMRMRIESSKKIIDNDSKVFIKDVAKRVGYHDQFYFSRIFKSIVGMSPSEYMDSKSSD